VFDVYGDSRENLLEIWAVAVVLSPISSVANADMYISISADGGDRTQYISADGGDRLYISIYIRRRRRSDIYIDIYSLLPHEKLRGRNIKGVEPGNQAGPG